MQLMDTAARTLTASVPASAAPPVWTNDGLSHSLPAAFARAQAAQPLPAPHWVARSEALAAELGMADWLHTDAALEALAGNVAPPGGLLATVY